MSAGLRPIIVMLQTHFVYKHSIALANKESTMADGKFSIVDVIVVVVVVVVAKTFTAAQCEGGKAKEKKNMKEKQNG